MDLEGFRQHILATSGKPATAASYMAAARHFVEMLERRHGGIADPVNAGTIEEFVRLLQGLKRSPTTIAARVVGVMRFCEWWRKNGGQVEKLEKPRLPRQTRKLPTILSNEDMRNFLDAVREHVPEPQRTALILLPLSGLRVGEMVSLLCSQVDMVDGSPVFSGVEGKSKARRDVNILMEGGPILADYLCNVRPGLPGSEGPYLFPSRKGGHLAKRAVENAVHHIIRRRIGKPRLVPHDLRHSFATALRLAGMLPEDIMSQLGHSNYSTTLGYLHLQEQRRADGLKLVRAPWMRG